MISLTGSFGATWAFNLLITDILNGLGLLILGVCGICGLMLIQGASRLKALKAAELAFCWVLLGSAFLTLGRKGMVWRGTFYPMENLKLEIPPKAGP